MSLPCFSLPLSEKTFLQDYWQQQPLLMRQAASNLDVVDGNLLAGLAMEDAVDSRLVTGTNQSNLTAQQGPFAEHTLTTLPGTDWTLLVQSVDHFLTEVSLLLDSFNFLPAWRLEDIMISYAAKGGSVGPHYDHYDVFLVQASGTRRWQLGSHYNDETALMPHSSLKLLAEMPVIQEYCLAPGDVLYLPPGLGHWGIADSDDCITWSVGFRSPDLYQLIDWLLAESEETRQPRLYRDGPRLPKTTAAMAGADLNSMLEQSLEALRALPTRDYLTRWLSLPRQETLDLVDVNLDKLANLCPNAALVRHGGTRLLLEKDDASRIYINGEPQSIPPDARPLVVALANNRLLTQDELQELTGTNAAKALISDWTKQGYLWAF